MDSFGRTIDYLRLSLTERCNERCLYCRPEATLGWRPQPDVLSGQDVVRIARVAVALGFRKFRLTGGEPLVRPDVPQIVRAIAQLPSVKCVSLSTNATRLAPLAHTLRDAGLRAVNISLDALNPSLYRRITGADLAPVLAGIHAAVSLGFERVKLNTVLMRGVNEEEIWPLIQFAAEHQLPLRFIELMPLTTRDVLTEKNFLPGGEVLQRLRQREQVEPLPEARLGHGPAKYFRLAKSGAVVGFIGAMTNLSFCDHCNKMRLTADGRLRPCLGHHNEIDLRPGLRAKTDTLLTELFQRGLTQKPWAHEFREAYQPSRPMTAIGG